MTRELTIVLVVTFVLGGVAGWALRVKVRPPCVLTYADVLRLASEIEGGVAVSSVPCRLVE